MLVIVATVKFMEGAWVIMLLVPIMVVGLVRLNKAYEAEHEELQEDARAAAEAPVMRRHAVVVLVDELDAAAARAMQYARTLTSDDLRAVHFDLDPWKTDQLTDAWQELGLSRFPLDIIECPDRGCHAPRWSWRPTSSPTASTELTVLIPRREYTQALAPHAARPLVEPDRGGDDDVPALHCHDRAVPPRGRPHDDRRPTRWPSDRRSDERATPRRDGHPAPRHRRAAVGPHADAPARRIASGQPSPVACVRCGCSRGAARRAWSARSPTRPAASPWCSSVAGRSAACAPER